jgi:TolA-binding protein
LGEVYYYQRNYVKAIEYYKNSASLYGKSPFMPVLLLHSGISLEKTKNNKEAKAFFKSLTRSFPNTKSSEMAQRHLNNLK